MLKLSSTPCDWRTAMRKLVCGWLTVAALGFTGCITRPHEPQAKQQGVYTIVAVEGRSQDMPDTGYRVCRTFNHGIMPAAVVTGYGSFDGTYHHPQAFTLEVVETDTGTVVLTRNGEAFHGKSLVYDLPIEKTGNYRLKLVMAGTVYDTWDFAANTGDAVGDTVGGGASPDSSGKPAGQTAWRFHFDIAPTSANAAFAEYDKLFLNDLDDACVAEADKSSAQFLSRAPRGKVVIQFNLDTKGLVHSAAITKSTLDEEYGKFFLRALKDGVPYREWPPGGRRALNSGTRLMVVTFRLE